MTIEHYIYLTPPFSTDITTEIYSTLFDEVYIIMSFKPPNVPITCSLRPVYTDLHYTG